MEDEGGGEGCRTTHEGGKKLPVGPDSIAGLQARSCTLVVEAVK